MVRQVLGRDDDDSRVNVSGLSRGPLLQAGVMRFRALLKEWFVHKYGFLSELTMGRSTVVFLPRAPQSIQTGASDDRRNSTFIDGPWPVDDYLRDASPC
jgi:hypothetical protein